MNSKVIATIKKWHEFISNADSSILDKILAEDVEFHSPVVWTPQKGKAISKIYLSAAGMLLKNFIYQKEIVSENEAALVFTAEIDDVTINGVDIITFDNKTGKIIEFKVMIRPLQAVNKIHQKMGELLQQMKR